LDKAYQRLLQYREALENPPLLVVCDFDQIVVHTNFVNAAKYIYTITLDDLQTPAGLARLHDIFYYPDAFHPPGKCAHFTNDHRPTPPPPPRPSPDPARDLFLRVVTLLVQAEEANTESPHYFAGWTTLLLNREPVAYRQDGEKIWRVVYGASQFESRVGKTV